MTVSLGIEGNLVEFLDYRICSPQEAQSLILHNEYHVYPSCTVIQSLKFRCLNHPERTCDFHQFHCYTSSAPLQHHRAPPPQEGGLWKPISPITVIISHRSEPPRGGTPVIFFSSQTDNNQRPLHAWQFYLPRPLP